MEASVVADSAIPGSVLDKIERLVSSKRARCELDRAELKRVVAIVRRSIPEKPRVEHRHPVDSHEIIGRIECVYRLRSPTKRRHTHEHQANHPTQLFRHWSSP